MFMLCSLGSDIGFSMFTLRENLDGFLKEVQVGLTRLVLFSRYIVVGVLSFVPMDKCAKVGLTRYPEEESTSSLVLHRLPLVCIFCVYLCTFLCMSFIYFHRWLIYHKLNLIGFVGYGKGIYHFLKLHLTKGTRTCPLQRIDTALTNFE